MKMLDMDCTSHRASIRPWILLLDPLTLRLVVVKYIYINFIKMIGIMDIHYCFFFLLNSFSSL